MKCPMCGADTLDDLVVKGEMTNEDWFNNLLTSAKSDFMAKMVTEAIKEHGKCGATRFESVIWWGEWLKQPHTPK